MNTNLLPLYQCSLAEVDGFNVVVFLIYTVLSENT